MKKVVFVHHSVGRQLMRAAGIRKQLKDDDIELTDTDYNRRGIHDSENRRINRPFVPKDSTDIKDYAYLLSVLKEDAFVHWLKTFDVVVLKTCFPNSDLTSNQALEDQKKQIETLILNGSMLFKKLLWVTPPPLTKWMTSKESAARAIESVRWTRKQSWPKNVEIFDLHTLLSESSGDEKGMLKKEYRRLPFDSHPNRKGAYEAGVQLAEAIRKIAS